jgi:phosphoglucomutase
LTIEDAAKVFERIESQMSIFEAESEGNQAVNFSYTDPVDGSVTKNQGYIFRYANGSRFVFRLSGTGSSGATIRVYLEKYNKDDINMKVEQALESISQHALSLCDIMQITGRQSPTVIT